jgi:hypothetical protein
VSTRTSITFENNISATIDGKAIVLDVVRAQSNSEEIAYTNLVHDHTILDCQVLSARIKTISIMTCSKSITL